MSEELSSARGNAARTLEQCLHVIAPLDGHTLTCVPIEESRVGEFYLLTASALVVISGLHRQSLLRLLHGEGTFAFSESLPPAWARPLLQDISSHYPDQPPDPGDATMELRRILRIVSDVEENNGAHPRLPSFPIAELPFVLSYSTSLQYLLGWYGGALLRRLRGFERCDLCELEAIRREIWQPTSTTEAAQGGPEETDSCAFCASGTSQQIERISQEPVTLALKIKESLERCQYLFSLLGGGDLAIGDIGEFCEILFSAIIFLAGFQEVLLKRLLCGESSFIADEVPTWAMELLTPSPPSVVADSVSSSAEELAEALTMLAKQVNLTDAEFQQLPPASEQIPEFFTRCGFLQEELARCCLILGPLLLEDQ